MPNQISGFSAPHLLHVKLPTALTILSGTRFTDASFLVGFFTGEKAKFCAQSMGFNLLGKELSGLGESFVAIAWAIEEQTASV